MGFILKYKVYVLYITVLLTVMFGVSIVFGSNIVFSSKVNYKLLSSNIFLDSNNLKNNLIVFSSVSDISKYRLETGCDLDTRYVGRKGSDYYFSINYDKGNKCLNPNIYLKSNGQIVSGSHIKFNIYSDFDIFNLYTDLSTNSLITLKNNLEKEVNDFALIKKGNTLDYVILDRKNQENLYKLRLLNSILENREKKYIVPVLNRELPTLYSKIPNSSRPYRQTYTDGIHHGWDIDTGFGEEVIALDDGIIIRVVNDFQFSDLGAVNYSDSSYDTKTKNLDILRGNQIWLKTSKGDVVFYSHLNSVNIDIKPGIFVSRGQVLGTVGKSGVPDKNYTDYHLHFAIQKNPYITKNAGRYSFFDYMKWDWYFKGSNGEYVLANQDKIFGNIELSFSKE